MAKKKNYFKLVTDKVKELKKTERGRGILFFSAYFVFFVFLFILFRVGGESTRLSEDYEYGDSIYLIDKVAAENYRFTYNIYIDNEVITYEGKKAGNKELFNFLGVDYYRVGDSYFDYYDNNWIIATNPYVFQEFLDFSKLVQIISDATYISKTEFDSGITLFTYQISSNSLIKKIENLDTDILEVPNSIGFFTDENLYLNRIELDLSSYGKFKGICTSNFKITLEYYDFGKIENIDEDV